ncbi:VWA domain-containing protein [Halorubrum halophilum]|uniref:VWA domain-containing protein n=1 Tax=Halorubrum halophilum TaxID=413816 RepID=UPI000679ADC1|nr:VWA domain-containing protein [Halorubrum halophilum]
MLPTDGDGVPDAAGIRDEVVEALVMFVRALRRAGVDVPANAGVVGAQALVEVGFDDEDRARAALRAALVTRAEGVETFDRLFGEFWRRLAAHLDGDANDALDDAPDGALAPLGAESAPSDEAAETAAAEMEPGDDWNDGDLPLVRSAIEPGASDGQETDSTTATYSPSGRPETVTVDVGALIDDDPLDAAVDRLVGSLASLRGRRWRRAGSGERADPRRALRQSVATGGTVASLPERARRETAVQVAVLADVSQSVLDVVDRGFLLRFLRTLTARVRRSRVFFFDSDVRDVTTAFDEPTTADAVRALERAETSWGGGTRIGHAVETVRREHSEAIDRRTVALIVSDGLEMGDVAGLEREMTWLASRSRGVLWLNPLAANPEYEPTPAGMAAALQAVNGLFAFIDSRDILEIARQLEQYGIGGRIGLEYDPRRRQKTTRPDTKTKP